MASGRFGRKAADGRKPTGVRIKTGGNMGEQGTRGLMTVGELASRVGVTVRTIQYYDQR